LLLRGFVIEEKCTNSTLNVLNGHSTFTAGREGRFSAPTFGFRTPAITNAKFTLGFVGGEKSVGGFVSQLDCSNCLNGLGDWGVGAVRDRRNCNRVGSL
jgi:hypothetical protein